MASSVTDCRSEAGMTTGLIDTILNAAHLLVGRDLSPPAVVEALRDLRSDAELRGLLDGIGYNNDERKTA